MTGSVAGFLLKKAGADVLALELLDAKTKEKLCGGIMNKRALTQVAEVFGEGCMDTLRPMHIEKVWDRYAGLEILIESDVYYALPRKRLDDYCLERYLQAGGMLQDRTTVREIDDSVGVAICADLRTGETFEVEFGRIIGADGAMSAVRRLLTGRNQRVGITLEGVVPLMSRDGVFEYLSREVGYSWYIPRGEDAVVGCGQRFHAHGEIVLVDDGAVVGVLEVFLDDGERAVIFPEIVRDEADGLSLEGVKPRGEELGNGEAPGRVVDLKGGRGVDGLGLRRLFLLAAGERCGAEGRRSGHAESATP